MIDPKKVLIKAFNVDYDRVTADCVIGDMQMSVELPYFSDQALKAVLVEASEWVGRRVAERISAAGTGEV